MTDSIGKYCEFLRYCIDLQQSPPDEIKITDWNGLYSFATQQAISAVVFNGIDRLNTDVKIPRELLFQWIGDAEQIKLRNQLLNKCATELVELFRNHGFKSVILKGQGNAVLYPNTYSRTPGDIDIWLEGKCIKEVIRISKEKNPNGMACYHHVDFGDFRGVEVEIHYRPSLMYNPLHNRRLQRWFCKMADGGCVMAELPDGAGAISIPNREFNIIFQLSHIYNHILHEGIGLRQMIDYYYVLKNTDGANLTNWETTLHYLGLEKIAGAVMWVLNEILGLSVEYLIAPKDERLGRILLIEILRGGNFGQYDDENIQANSQLKKNWQRIKRDVRMVRYFPSECLWEPVFRIYHFMWRKWYN